MASFALVDTGVLLAHLRAKDRHHAVSTDLLVKVPKPLITTDAVLTEVFYFITGNRKAVSAMWQLMTSGIVTLAAITSDDLEPLQALMTRYADRPMDFADATLVHVAGREGIATILTIDHDDFETYRFGRNRKFRIYPGRES